MALNIKDITVSSTSAKIVQKLNNVPPANVGEIIERLGSIEVFEQLFPTKFEQFFKNQPKILFVCDYVVEEKLIGALLVFRSYFDATHYEVFKKNKFDNDPKFERILFLNNVALETETQKLLPYLENTGFSFNENDIFVILDDNVKKDRIYEYFVRAVFVPEKIEDFSPSEILKSKEMIDISNPSNQQDLSKILNWTSGLFNVQVSFFQDTEPQLSNFTEGVLVLQDNENLVKLINDAVYLFGLKKTIFRLIDLINKKEEQLNKFVKDCFELSIDETAGIFSFETFKVKLATKKTFTFKNTGNISFNSFENLTTIFETLKVVNKIISEPPPKTEEESEPEDTEFSQVLGKPFSK